MKPVYNRDFEAEGWPFIRMSDVVALGEEAEGLVRETAGKARFSGRLAYGDHGYDLAALDDLRGAADLPLDGLAVVSIDVNQDYGTDERISVSLNVYRLREKSVHVDLVKFTVRGTNRTVVEGITVQLTNFVNRAIERRREAETEAETAANAKIPTRVPTSPETEPQPVWRRVVNNLWTVTIVGGLIAVVVGGVVLALLL